MSRCGAAPTTALSDRSRHVRSCSLSGAIGLSGLVGRSFHHFRPVPLLVVACHRIARLRVSVVSLKLDRCLITSTRLAATLAPHGVDLVHRGPAASSLGWGRSHACSHSPLTGRRGRTGHRPDPSCPLAMVVALKSGHFLKKSGERRRQRS